jgi:ACS family hexuronate transporter-like MFS transporter
VEAGEWSSPGAPRYRFVILGVVWTAYLIVFVARLTVGPLAPFLKDAFSLSNAQIGGLTSATAIAYAPTLIVAGWLADRFGVRLMLLVGTFVTGACVALMFFAQSYATLFALLALSGFGCGCVFPSAIRAVMLWFPPRERATAIGFNQAAINVGGVIGGVTLPTVAGSLGWQYGFLFVGLFGLVICAACALLYRDPPLPASARGAAGAEPTLLDTAEVGCESGVEERHGWRHTWAVLRCRDMWVLCLAGMFFGAVEFSVMAHLVLYLKEALAFSAVAAGGLLALCQIAGAVGKPVSGLVSDRLLGGRRRPALVALALLSTVACAGLAALGPGQRWLVYLCLFLLGATAIGWGGLYGTTAGEIGGRTSAGFAAGLAAAALNLGIIAGPPLFGALVDATGSYAASWTAMAVSSVLTAICFGLVRESPTPGSERLAADRPAAG